MPNFLAMSFEGTLAPSFDLRCLHPGHKLPDGWGIGFYPGNEPAAIVLKEPAPPSGSIRSELIKVWEHLESSLFLLHIRTATWGTLTDANTQPFKRAWARRDWLLAHSGSLTHRLDLTPSPHFEPIGSTDTELLFCELMTTIASNGWRSIGDVDPLRLQLWFDSVNEHGSMTMVLTDGLDLCVYADRNDQGGVFVWELLPPYGRVVFGDDDLEVDLSRRGIKSRKGVLVSSDLLLAHGDHPSNWRRLAPGSLMVVREGAIRVDLPALPRRDDAPRTNIAARPAPRLPAPQEPKELTVTHRTVYRYDKPVERSMHVLRLIPVHDRLQTLLDCQIDFSVEGKLREYDDVFGNRARRMLVETPFSELVIESRSRVRVLDADPLGYRPLRARSTIPLVWMPWQREVLQPFLLPPELPESELHELTEYAMSFVQRNDADLLDTLLDMNASIYGEYEYKQGTTTLTTSPFDTYAGRVGVCQDFANLFICLARLLSVPARYTCGYIYTGPIAHRMSEASHAWAQVYLPEVGWRGFDPTNGILTQTEHVRVAVGRNFRDATPTSGTIYVGGGTETLEVAVRVELAT
jgi:transglutaminase-like putative cysteine protease/predicted glutamine amidotransferase